MNAPAGAETVHGRPRICQPAMGPGAVPARVISDIVLNASTSSNIIISVWRCSRLPGVAADLMTRDHTQSSQQVSRMAYNSRINTINDLEHRGLLQAGQCVRCFSLYHQAMCRTARMMKLTTTTTMCQTLHLRHKRRQLRMPLVQTSLPASR